MEAEAGSEIRADMGALVTTGAWRPVLVYAYYFYVTPKKPGSIESPKTKLAHIKILTSSLIAIPHASGCSIVSRTNDPLFPN